MYIDSHAHYDLKCFNKDRHELLTKMHESGLEYIINPAIGYDSNNHMMEKLALYDWIYYAIGIHPNTVGIDDSVDEKWMEHLTELANHKKVVAIGETGLDYHRLTSDETGCLDWDFTKKIHRQKQWFHRLIKLALSTDLPLILHIRDAHADAFEIMQQYEFPSENAGVVHCFCGDPDIAARYIDMGFYLGIGGRITQDEPEIKAAVRNVPLSSIVLETDAPYVMPEGATGKRNTSDNIPMIAEAISRIKNISVEEVFYITNNNSKKLFGLVF